MTKSLMEVLHLLRQGRKDLLETYTETNSDRYRYSFQYHRSPAALAIASSLLDHQWFDNQIERAFDHHNNAGISTEALLLFLKSVNKLSIFHTETIFEGHQNLLKTKILGLQSLLNGTEKMDQKLRNLEFDYYRDKVLFEREMEKYSQEMNLSNHE